MKSILVALNAKYIHTNPAVRLLASCAEAAGINKSDISFYEASANESPRSILGGLYGLSADIYLFSCYIWNVDIVKKTACELRKLLPGCVIAAGGPEVNRAAGSFLEGNPAFDYVFTGEGENSLPAFLKLAGTGMEKDCPGIAYRGNVGIVVNSTAPAVDMDDLPFAYEDIAGLGGRVLYYESMRGCPFLCSYCLSSAESGVRLRDISLVKRDLERFLNARPLQVKFVDRTFNAAKTHAMQIWEYLMENDNGVTNFHFEMSGELIDGEMLALLEKARPGLFQFEIGVQSLNTRTLREISRRCDFERLSENVRAIKSMGNIQLHLDLIAGLPYEDFRSFSESFGGVYALRPDKLQLGFLKVLSGTGIEEKAAGYGMLYSDKAPYEILQTKWLSFTELNVLHGISDMLDVYHNSGRFRNIIEYILDFFESPFEFFRSLWEFYLERGFDRVKPSKLGYYDILGDFMEQNGIRVTEKARWLCKLDVVSHEKPRKIPGWANVDISRNYYGQIIDFLSRPDNMSRFFEHYKGYDPNRLFRAVHVEYFPFDPISGGDGLTAMLFDYAAGRIYAFEVLENGHISKLKSTVVNPG